MMEMIKRYVFVYSDYQDLNPDLRLMIGSIILEYLFPLFKNDPTHYLLE
jgi:hypothetical protein